MKVSAIKETRTYKRLKDIVDKSRAAAQLDLNMAKYAIKNKVRLLIKFIIFHSFEPQTYHS